MRNIREAADRAYMAWNEPLPNGVQPQSEWAWDADIDEDDRSEPAPERNLTRVADGYGNWVSSDSHGPAVRALHDSPLAVIAREGSIRGERLA